MPSSRSSSEASAEALHEPLRAAAQALPAYRGILVAYSGGRDSTALLAACNALFPGTVRAAHIHHGLHSQADAWAAHCAEFCAARGVDLVTQRVTVQADGQGLEAAARRARHEALYALMAPGEILAMAHHADDQAETVLFRLLRGGGHPLGMRALRPMRTEQVTQWLWRPFLTVPRARISDYCRARGLAYVDDPGNEDGASNARARLRTLMPELERLVPGAGEALRRQALRQEAAAACEAVDLGPDLARRLHDGTLDARGLLAWSVARRRALLRAWMRLLGVPVPGDDWLAHCERELLAAAADAQPELAQGPWRLRRFDGRLWLLPDLTAPPRAWQVNWDGGEDFVLPAAAGWLRRSAGPPRALGLRFARAGEALAFRDGARRQKLKTHFQAMRVPPWQRCRTPVLLVGEEPVQLGNRRLAAAEALLGETRVEWLHAGWHRRPQAV